MRRAVRPNPLPSPLPQEMEPSRSPLAPLQKGGTEETPRLLATWGKRSKPRRRWEPFDEWECDLILTAGSEDREWKKTAAEINCRREGQGRKPTTARVVQDKYERLRAKPPYDPDDPAPLVARCCGCFQVRAVSLSVGSRKFCKFCRRRADAFNADEQ